MKILALDLSSKTGWAYYDSAQDDLIDVGCIEQVKLGLHKDYKLGNSTHPWDFWYATASTVARVHADCLEYMHQADFIVIEMTTLGRNRFSQRFLEWIHHGVLDFIFNDSLKDKVRYVDVSEWRKILNLKLTKEDKLNNRKISKEKRNIKKLNEGKDRKDKTRIKTPRTGKLTIKKVVLNYIIEKFNLSNSFNNDDIADAIAIAVAFSIKESNEKR